MHGNFRVSSPSPFNNDTLIVLRVFSLAVLISMFSIRFSPYALPFLILALGATLLNYSRYSAFSLQKTGNDPGGILRESTTIEHRLDAIDLPFQLQAPASYENRNAKTINQYWRTFSTCTIQMKFSTTATARR